MLTWQVERCKKLGVLVEDDHFVYASGRHGAAYLRKELIITDPKLLGGMCRKISGELLDSQQYVFAAPAVAGIAILGCLAGIISTPDSWSSHLITTKPARFVFAEKDGDDFVFKRGYDQLLKSANVIVVEDVLTTGGTVKKVIAQVKKHGGTVVSVGALCNRGGITAQDLGVKKLFSCIDINLETFAPEGCPLCKAGQPINTMLGHGATYVAKHGQPMKQK